jgi:predicted RNA-binding protein with RPS1 domain
VVTYKADHGVFVDLGGIKGLVPNSEIGQKFMDSSRLRCILDAGDRVEVRVLSIDKEHGQVSLSLRVPRHQPPAGGDEPDAPAQARQERLGFRRFGEENAGRAKVREVPCHYDPLAAARAIEDPYHRSLALALLADQLAPGEAAGVFTEALAVAHTIEDPDARRRALAEVERRRAEAIRLANEPVAGEEEEPPEGAAGAPDEATQQRIERLVEQLDDPDPKVRGPAYYDLLDHGPHAVPTLTRALNNASPRLAYSAMRALRKIARLPDAPPSALRAIVLALAAQLHHPDGEVVSHAAYGLTQAVVIAYPEEKIRPEAGAAAKDATVALAQALHHKAASARADVADALAEISRAAAADALGDIRAAAQSAVPDLCQLLRDQDERVRASAADALRSLTGEEFLAKAEREAQYESEELLGGPVTPREEEPEEKKQPGFVAQEQPSPAEQLHADLVSRLKGLIPTLPADPEGKARQVLDLTHSFNQVFRGALRDEMRPVVKQLLQDIPGNYEGKRERAALVNGLLTALDLGIQVHDDHGRPHVCGVFAARARETDYKGSFRLRERTISGTSQKTYPVPSSPDQIEIIDTSRQEPAALPDHPQPARSGRGG